MVVNVYVEGGIINGNVDATTNNNSEALREELNRFMQRALNRNDISIVVKKCSGYKEAAKQFIKATDNGVSCPGLRMRLSSSAQSSIASGCFKNHASIS